MLSRPQPGRLGLLLAPALEVTQPCPQRQQPGVILVRQRHRITIASCHDEYDRLFARAGVVACDDSGPSGLDMTEASAPGPSENEPRCGMPGLEGSDPAIVDVDEAALPESASFPDDESLIGTDRRPRTTTERALGDFTATPAILRLVPLALLIGALGAGISLALLDMIGFFTSLLYYQRLSVTLVSPAANTLGAVALVIPVGGGLIVGLMARYGSEQIRGHGIPEAMERVLINGSRVQPRLAVLKPISSAVSIGTGGPFGAEGPIILTGGAVGSIVGQLFRLTAAQRRALLVAGAAAGMAAVFGTPIAATLFGVELLAFEFKPRSMVLIGLAAATADGIRMAMASAGLVTPQPIFPVPAHAALGGVVLLGAAAVGVACGLGAWIMTQAVYRFEDLFKK